MSYRTLGLGKNKAIKKLRMNPLPLMKRSDDLLDKISNKLLQKAIDNDKPHKFEFIRRGLSKDISNGNSI